MDRSNRGFYLIAGAVLLSLAGQAYADGRRDFYFQQATKRYFDRFENARTFGMGGSSVATSTDSSSVAGNPAGLGMMQDGEVSATYGYDTISGKEQDSYRDLEEKIDTGQVLGAFPLVPTSDGTPLGGNVGVGWTGYDSEYEDDSFNGESDGYRAALAYGKSISDSTALGYSLTYFNDELKTDIFEYSGDNGFRHTFGVISNLSDATTFGSSVFFGHGDHDVDTGGQSGTSEQREYGVDVGVKQKVAETTAVTASADYQYYDTDGDVVSASPDVWVGGDETGHVFNVRAGIEQQITDWFDVRAGYRYAGYQDYDFERDELDKLNGSAKHNAWSLGAGVEVPLGYYVKSLKLDYGVEYRAVGDDDWEHVVTASLPLEFCKPE